MSVKEGMTDFYTMIFLKVHQLRTLFRLVAISRGEQEYFDPSGIATATEACKSNALMRCCKDLGIASELWLVQIMSRCSILKLWSPGIPVLSVNSKPSTA